MFLVFLLGLAFGSFVSVVSYRLPRGLPFISGRSFCPNCKHKIYWHDNIPLVSFFLLRGCCRYCSKKISWRYPLLEITTGIGFVFIYLSYLSCFGQVPTLSSDFFCSQVGRMSFFTLPYWLFTFILLLIVFVIDFENKVVFDSLVFFLFIFFLATSLFFSDSSLYLNLLVAFSISLFFLFLHIFTFGRGMGLGDVKLALPIGFYFGFPLGIIWVFLSFLTGAITGIILIIVGKAEFGKPIPFGPFMIVSFWLTLFLGEELVLFLK